MISDNSIPELINKLWAGVNQVKTDISNKGISVANIGQSRYFYGFYIHSDFGDINFCYSHESWEKYNTPYMKIIITIIKESP